MEKKTLRKAIIDKATELFAERGLHGVSIRELSASAGVSISMISYHFEGKDGLYSAVLLEQFKCFEYLEEIKSLSLTPIEKIEKYINWSIQRNREFPFLLRYYTSELTNPTRHYKVIVGPILEKALHSLIDIIVEGVEAGDFRQGLDPEDTALAMAGMVNYYFLSKLATEEFINHSPDRDNELVRHYMDIFTKGIMAEDALP